MRKERREEGKRNEMVYIYLYFKKLTSIKNKHS